MARPGLRLPPVTLYADAEQVESVFKKTTKPHMCVTCGEAFNLLTSMGCLQCFQHPGYIQEDGVWSCCGEKILPMRWSPNIDLQRMYVGNQCAPVVPRVKGCQPCDHNSSEKKWDHTDACEITSLAAIIPHLNKHKAFHLRDGFDSEGLLRRCSIRPLHVPKVLGAIVTYMAKDGELLTYVVEYYENDHKIFWSTEELEWVRQESDTLPDNIKRRPNGLEKRAVTKEGRPILKWW